MHLYTTDPYNTNLEIARLRDYFAETQMRIQNIAATRDKVNPNFIVLNQKVNSNSIMSLRELLENNLLRILIDKTASTSVCYMIILPNQLRLHRGIINEYGSHCLISLTANWSQQVLTYSNCNDSEKALIKGYLSKFQIKDFDWMNELPIWIAKTNFTKEVDLLNANNTSFSTITLTDKNNNIADIYLIDKNNIILGNETIALYSINQGYVIFCNSIEEQEPVDVNSTMRQTITSYSLINAASFNAFYMPSSISIVNNTASWTWIYVDKATEKYGNEILINFNLNSLRYSYPNDFEINSSLDAPSNVAYAYEISGGAIKPLISSKIGTIWTDFQINIIQHKIYTKTDTTEEEIFIDDTINYGVQNVAYMNKSYYNINIKHNDNFPIELYARLW